MNENVKVAIVGGVVSVVVALITAFTQTKATLENEKPAFIEDARSQLEVSVTGVPVGTVVASMISPKEFAELVGDSTNFDTRTSNWVPVDGRSVAGSRYASAATSTVPDMRGMFIRGLNYSEKDLVRTDGYADSNSNRVVGSLQDDSTKLPNIDFILDSKGMHYHLQGYDDTAISGKFGKADGGSNAGRYEHSPDASAAGNSSAKTNDSGDHTHIIAGGDPETRPKNIALFYYIKIN